MDIEKIKKTIDEFNELPIIEHEKTVFDIGTRGHFENPTTDVLAFFCNSTEQHGMGDLVAKSMVSLLNKCKDTVIPDSHSPIYPEREVRTDQGKRIDLLLSTDSYLIVIEAKVGHDQINPFDEYEEYAEELAKELGKKVFYVVLSPQGQVDNAKKYPRWLGISFSNLAKEIKVNLQQHFFNEPFNKWSLILKDFILHMENFMGTCNTNEIHQFALKNIHEISTAWSYLNDSLKQSNDLIIASCSSYSKQVFKSCKSNWFPPLPAYTYCFEDSNCKIVLFSSSSEMDRDKKGNNEANSGKHLFIQVHVSKKYPALYQTIFDTLNKNENGKPVNYWDDAEYYYLRWPVENLSVSEISDEILKTIKDVYDIEEKFI